MTEATRLSDRLFPQTFFSLCPDLSSREEVSEAFCLASKNALDDKVRCDPTNVPRENLLFPGVGLLLPPMAIEEREQIV